MGVTPNHERCKSNLSVYVLYSTSRVSMKICYLIISFWGIRFLKLMRGTKTKLVVYKRVNCKN